MHWWCSLAKGYLNQPKLTAERFIQSPFNNEMLYRSGDLVRLQEDGYIDYIVVSISKLKYAVLE